jgi:hypothetical protein
MQTRNKEPENKEMQAESSLNKKYRSLKSGLRPNKYSYYAKAWSI